MNHRACNPKQRNWSIAKIVKIKMISCTYTSNLMQNIYMTHILKLKGKVSLHSQSVTHTCMQCRHLKSSVSLACHQPQHAIVKSNFWRPASQSSSNNDEFTRKISTWSSDSIFSKMPGWFMQGMADSSQLFTREGIVSNSDSKHPTRGRRFEGITQRRRHLWPIREIKLWKMFPHIFSRSIAQNISVARQDIQRDTQGP